MTDLTQLSRKQLQQYILENRNDENKVNAAISESAKRPGWTEVSADISPEETERIIQNLTGKNTN